MILDNLQKVAQKQLVTQHESKERTLHFAATFSRMLFEVMFFGQKLGNLRLRRDLFLMNA